MTSRTYTHPTEGWTLRGDAAASLLRMRADGCPAGGIDVYSRTMAEQAELRRRYLAGLGPVAAKPSPTAPHIDGRAIDTKTTRAGKYQPSSAHAWLTAGGRGDKSPQRGEQLREHAYGWRRTVPSERWHHAYDPTLDTRAAADLRVRLAALGYASVASYQRSRGLTDDGKAGPVTWASLLRDADKAAANKPTPKPTPPITTSPEEDDMQLTDRVTTSWGTVTVAEALAAAAELKQAPGLDANGEPLSDGVGSAPTDLVVARIAAAQKRIEAKLDQLLGGAR